MTRLLRNPNIKVGDKVRIHAEPVHPIGIISIEPSPEEVGSVAVVTAVITYDYDTSLDYDYDTSLDYDADYRLEDGSYHFCDSQFLEIV